MKRFLIASFRGSRRRDLPLVGQLRLMKRWMITEQYYVQDYVKSAPMGSEKDKSRPWHCHHDHGTNKEAKDCALQAIQALVDAGWARWSGKPNWQGVVDSTEPVEMKNSIEEA